MDQRAASCASRIVEIGRPHAKKLNRPVYGEEVRIFSAGNDIPFVTGSDTRLRKFSQ